MMRRLDAADLAHLLSLRAEEVCRHYLSNGRREGNYWLVGDIHNTPGRSLFVRLTGSETGKGAAGKWTDSSSGDYGDLLDLIRESRGLYSFRDVADEARAFLSLSPEPQSNKNACHRASVPAGSIEAVKRLWNASVPIAGTLSETYLHKRGLTALCETAALRHHPRCFYRPDASMPSQSAPAMIAAVTDEMGRLTGIQRTWLDPESSGKALIETPRRALGNLLGHGVRFPGMPFDVMAAGEGIETVLSLRVILPRMPMVAALSANHLSALSFPQRTGLRRLYIVRDDDPAGNAARDRLTERAQEVGIEAITVSPLLGDFNDDLQQLGIGELRAALWGQLAPEDVGRFMN